MSLLFVNGIVLIWGRIMLLWGLLGWRLMMFNRMFVMLIRRLICLNVFWFWIRILDSSDVGDVRSDPNGFEYDNSDAR